MIAGVLKRQMDEAKTVGADQVVATDDDNAIANLPMLDVVADTVNGKTAETIDRQGQAGRSVCFRSRGTAERREVSICKGGASILEIRQENARAHGRSGARWQASNPD